jgi:hypothetical protein
MSEGAAMQLEIEGKQNSDRIRAIARIAVSVRWN